MFRKTSKTKVTACKLSQKEALYTSILDSSYIQACKTNKYAATETSKLDYRIKTIRAS